MNAHRRAALIQNVCYVPPPARGDRIRAELGRDWRTFRMLVRQIGRSLKVETWFAIAAVVAGAIVAGFLT